MLAVVRRVDDVEVSLIADLIRDTGPQVAAATLETVAELGELGVVGVGLGGSEQSFPHEPFAPSTSEPGISTCARPSTPAERPGRRASRARSGCRVPSGSATAPAPPRTSPWSATWRAFG